MTLTSLALLMLVFRVAYSLDPDALRNVSELITSKGYPVEEYNVTTGDGYLIGMQRIPRGYNELVQHSSSSTKTVVLLLHGVLSSSADFVINFPDQSLGFLLADAGYDVWLGNLRGNTYTYHTTLSRDEDEFWNFSTDDMIRYDISAQIDMVLNVTKQAKLQFLGWSQGTLVLFGLLSERPEYNKKITLFSGMGPIGQLGDVVTPLRVLLPFRNIIARGFKRVTGGRFLASSPAIKLLANTVCAGDLSSTICVAGLFFVTGVDAKDFNKTRMPVYLSHDPAGTSVNNYLQLAQNCHCDCFAKFDYGVVKNTKVYGQVKPPLYNISKTTVPTALYYSRNDWYATPKNVEKLKKQLPNIVEYYEVKDKQLTHFDFGWGVNTVKVLYSEMMSVMEKYRTH